jgi:hypothetical protein
MQHLQNARVQIPSDAQNVLRMHLPPVQKYHVQVDECHTVDEETLIYLMKNLLEHQLP